MEHSFDIDVAKEYGILEAVIIRNFQYWTHWLVYLYFTHSVGFGIAYPRLEGIPEPDLRDER